MKKETKKQRDEREKDRLLSEAAAGLMNEISAVLGAAPNVTVALRIFTMTKRAMQVYAVAANKA